MRAVYACLLSLMLSAPAVAGDLQGRITDRTGGVLRDAAVRVVNLASGGATTIRTDTEGRYRVADLPPGLYLVSASAEGFSEASRTIVVGTHSPDLRADFALELGTFETAVTVAAARGVRDTRTQPIRADTITADTIRHLTPTTTGDVLLQAPGVTAVGSGPFQVRPRLRGLDSTRVLVLVNGERLNNARTATDRAGVEVGLVDVASIEAIEVLGGAGSVLYGTDALAGTINIITNRPRFTDALQFTSGFDGLYSTNDDGRRGTVTLGASSRRWAVRFVGGAEHYGNYRAGSDFAEDTSALHDDGVLTQGDTIDDAFGFAFDAFPDPFNAAFARTTAVIPQSGMDGTSADIAAIGSLAPTQELRIRYQRRRAEHIGFPDFESPTFFQSITLPESEYEKFSASYSWLDVTPWLRRLSASAYVQRQDRVLRNQFPVQFPAPTPGAFFPIGVFQLQIDSETRQQVTTPGVELQANIQVRPDNVLTTGLTVFADRSRDERTTVTQMSMVGAVDLGRFGPAASVLDSPVLLGPPIEAHPVRVPDGTFRDVGLFVHDEWNVSPAVNLTGGLRLDAYRVTTRATSGYEVDGLVAGATPGIDPATLPDINGDRISRTALTGEAGVVLWSDRPVSIFGHYVRSYRHPNLEELLFSGPATTGNIVPNLTVAPETGHNIDVGMRLHASRIVASASYFHNRYDNFISTEVVADSPAGSISQAINLAKVRIQGVEGQVDVPFEAAGLYWMPHMAVSLTRGTVLEGTSPLTEASLEGAPQDNITPSKALAGIRVSDLRERWWASYDVRAQGAVERVSPLLSDSPFLIAQDLLALDGFALHRIAVGYNLQTNGDRLGLTLAVDNLTDTFYREQFQFAPARGRTVTFAVTVRGVR